MSPMHAAQIADELKLSQPQIQAVAVLLEEGATVPFIARYRKETTGSLDEVLIASVRDRLAQLKELDDRKQAVLKSLEQNNHLTDELRDNVLAAPTLAILEDIYLPYKPKRRTKAMAAREKGLEPLAMALFEQAGIHPEQSAGGFVDPEKGVESIDEALSGARDIIAEMVNEDAQVRSAMRLLFSEKSVIDCRVATGKEEAGAKYKDYFEWREPAASVPSHRLLAMRRGESEDVLNLTIAPSEDEAVALLEKMIIRGEGPDSAEVALAIRDCYKRLLSRSMETEIRMTTKTKADEEAIRVFAENLRELLLAAPLGARRVMGIDPGFRTGCKVVCLDRQGKLLHHDTIYPHTGEGGARQAGDVVASLCEKYRIEAIAVGNGTAGRETEAFIKKLDLPESIHTVMVNESGASIYSASEAAREEFPDLDLTVRGSVSIGRRLMDPLAELVKIDPKSIGVGQYQHDVDQSALKRSLDDVVESCVNAVGVDVNRASVQLLTYVSGLGPHLAKNILVYRNENGPFQDREDLKKVPRLGPKAFEQSAGFLRIHEGRNPLDNSAVHPESYPVVEQMARDLGCTVWDLMALADLRRKIKLSDYTSETVGLPTLNDIMRELAKPGRDPRKKFEVFEFADGITEISDLITGMQLPGIVTNVTRFGAFVDIGVHQDGLVHISQLADHFVKDPAEVIKVNQRVTVMVVGVDTARKRISLSMKSDPDSPGPENQETQKQKIKKPHQKPENAKNRPFHNPFEDVLRKIR